MQLKIHIIFYLTYIVINIVINIRNNIRINIRINIIINIIINKAQRLKGQFSSGYEFEITFKPLGSRMC